MHVDGSGGSSAVILFSASALLSLIKLYFAAARESREIGYNVAQKNPAPKTDFDVIIVGSGPAGSTSAYFLAKQGFKVALYDKKKFPRHKPCGDAWCSPALDILSEMGILKQMEDDKIVKVVQRGGFISPYGHKCVNTEGATYGTVTGCKTYAIKRFIADEYLVRAAAANDTVSLFEETEVQATEFIPAGMNGMGYWKIGVSTVSATKSTTATTAATTDASATTAATAPERIVTAPILLVCDGSTSYLGQKLGIVPKGSQPEAVCSHAYVKHDTHNWHEADGVMIFNHAVLPGYSALFRHYNDDMYLGTYILPGGKATSRAIAPFELEAIETHPYIKEAFGDKYDWEEKRVVAPIRLGGVPRSYDHQVLLVGDAAGHVDPLTGEGIHTAMIAGKIAAKAVGEMFATGDFSMRAGRAYELRCYDAFAHEFFYSSLAARVIYHLPIALDAVAVVGQRRGQAFLDFFGEVMTGVKPKSEFLRPGLLLDISIEIVRQFFVQYVLRRPALIPQDIGKKVVDDQAAAKNKKMKQEK